MAKQSSLFKRGILIALATLSLDQFHKWAMLEVVHIAERQPIRLTPFFDLVILWNNGISFGMFQRYANGRFILSLVALTIIFILLLWLRKINKSGESFAIGLVMGGALGNVIDRLRFGAVADFFDFHVAGYHWPAFNVADSAVCVGAFILCYTSIFVGKPRKPSTTESSGHKPSGDKHEEIPH